MEILNEIITYVFNFESYVLLPIILFLMSLIFRISIKKALRSSLTIGIGFIGIFMVLGYFVENIGPAVEALTANTGLNYNVFDIGWPPLATISWSFYLAPLLIVLIIILNIIMLVLKQTKTVNVDIWNFWHFILLARMVYEVSNSTLLAVVSSLILCIITLKLADWTAGNVNKFTGLSGISITTLSAVIYYPIAIVMNKLMDRVKFIENIDADPEYLRKKLGLAGEPMIIGFVIGILLGIGTGFDIKGILELSFTISAVIYILPLVAGILGKGLMEVSEGMKTFIKNRFPETRDIYIGLDLAVLLGNPAIIVTGVLLMPVALILAFMIPGVNFIPLGDLSNIIGAASLVVIAAKGNIIRSIIVFIPIIIGKLLVASRLAPMFTRMVSDANFSLEGYHGLITGFLDGGNLLRYWFLELFSKNYLAFFLLPLLIYLLWFTRRESMVLNNRNK